MDLILVGDRFEQEIKPLVKAFFQNDPVKTIMEAIDEELAWPTVVKGKLFYCAKKDRLLAFDGKRKDDNSEMITEPFFVSYGCILHTGEERFHIAFLKENCVSDWTEEAFLHPKDRKSSRNQLGRALYRILSRETGRTLPWGILTGVRPTKLVYEMLTDVDHKKNLSEKEENKRQERLSLEEDKRSNCVEEQKIFKHMREEYLCSAAKIEVSLEVAKKEIDLLKQMDYRNGYSLYVGIPFCPTTCHYCSFPSFPLSSYGQWVVPYLDALEKELDSASTLFPNRPLHTVYFGGGTPTSLSTEQLERIIHVVKSRFNLSNCIEFTVEAGRPDSITKEKLLCLKELGVHRISINPQTMNEKTLNAIGRKHTTGQVIDAFWLARECGHTNINMDIILGLKDETPSEVQNTLSQIAFLDPDSLTVHTLALKRAARLNIEGQHFSDIGASNVPESQRLTESFAKQQGYHPYYLYRQKNMAENLENIGYAKPGKECLYNVLIMEEKQTILACGSGGSSKFVYQGSNPKDGIRIERVENVKNVNHYINRIDEMIERRPAFLRYHSDLLFLDE